jgi:hypothetical protein
MLCGLRVSLLVTAWTLDHAVALSPTQGDPVIPATTAPGGATMRVAVAL